MVEYSNVFVVLMGIGVVFFGLTCIVILTVLMGKIMQAIEHKEPVQNAVANVKQEKPFQGIRPEIIAIITSVLSEETDTSAEGLNILGIKKL